MPILKIKTDNKAITAAAGESLTKICDKNDTSLLFGCRDGACGTCLIRVLDNPQNLTPMADHERDFLETIGGHADERLACQCKILGDVTIEVSE